MLDKLIVANQSDFETAKHIFEYLNIETEYKTYFQLMDEVELHYKKRLSSFHQKYGEGFLDKFNSDFETQLLETLLKHLANVYRWVEY
jgi:hypothetical protein